MTLVLRYAVRSDVGLLREGNEDSAYAGPRLLAVADGMGGHAAGEVASSLTIASMAKLDSEPPGGDMLAELTSAVAAANTRLQEMIIANPALTSANAKAVAHIAGPRVISAHAPTDHRPQATGHRPLTTRLRWNCNDRYFLGPSCVSPTEAYFAAAALPSLTLNHRHPDRSLHARY